MKIKKEKLKQIIKEELQAIMKEGHGQEGKMAQGQLRRISELANMIADQFDDGSNLEEWVEAKITKSQDYLSSVMNYMRGQSFPKARAVRAVQGDFPQLSEAVTPLAQAVNEVVEGVFERLGLKKDDHKDIEKYARGEAKELLSHEDADGKQMYLQPAKWGTVVAVVKKRVEKKYSLGEVQSDALTQQIAFDKRQKELEKAKKRKASEKTSDQGLTAMTPSEVADEILAKRAKPKFKLSKGGVMVSGVPVAKFEESLQRIFEEELQAVLNEDGHEDVPSARRAMMTIIEDAGQMLETLEQMDGHLPTWWTNKMAVAASMLNKMRDYLLVDSDVQLTESAKFHINHEIPITENIYRRGTNKYFELFREIRELSSLGMYKLNEEEKHLIEETDIGEFGMFEGQKVPLDFPMLIEEDFDTINEKKKKKNPPLNKPSLNTGGGKKYKVFVRNPKTGGIKKVTFGDKKGGLKGNWNNAEARASFAKRHKCAEKKDKTKAGYWACRAHKYFGKNVPGRFW